MSWTSTLLAACVASGVGLFVSGYLANLAVSWYRISSFEGGSGYFVVFAALGGGLASLVLTLVISRLMASGADPTFVKSLGLSLLCILALATMVGGSAWLLADIPPTIDGEPLLLIVEARWPADRVQSPADVPGVSHLTLGSTTFSRVQRLSRSGALWKEDAQRVDGRWTVRGAVEIFTTRGTPVIEIVLGDDQREGFVLPLRSRPEQQDLEWSDWYPRDGRNGPVRTNGLTYRYRVQKRSVPVRSETAGPFVVGAAFDSFSTEAAEGTSTLDANAEFTIGYLGQPVEFSADANAQNFGVGRTVVRQVALLPGAVPALLLLVAPEYDAAFCVVLAADDGVLRTMRVAQCNFALEAQVITADPARFESMRHVKPPRGRLDRRTYQDASLLLFPGTILDVRSRSLHPYSAPVSTALVPNVPPLGVSPDGRSVVLFARGDAGETEPLLVVVDFLADSTRTLPIDSSRMRYGKLEALNPAWLLHHFQWQPASAAEGDTKDQLVVRPDFIPIPYHGNVTTDSAGAHDYRIEKGTPALRMVLVELLVKEFNATREPADVDAFEYGLIIEGQKVTVACSDDFGAVLVSLAYGQQPSDLVSKIANRFNALLATGQYDPLFTG